MNTYYVPIEMVITGKFVACDLAMSYNHRMKQFGLPIRKDHGTRANPRPYVMQFQLTVGHLQKAGWFNASYNRLNKKLNFLDPYQKLVLILVHTEDTPSDTDTLPGETNGVMYLLYCKED